MMRSEIFVKLWGGGVCTFLILGCLGGVHSFTAVFEWTFFRVWSVTFSSEGLEASLSWLVRLVGTGRIFE